MHSIKTLAYALFFVFLCIAPIFANAQDDSGSRLIDVPNVENDDKKLSMTKAIIKALGNAGHIVFSQEEMLAVASQAGKGDAYWLIEGDIAEVNKKARHDAVIRFVHHKKGRKGSLVIYIHNAYTGALIGELERRLKKKGKLSSSDLKAIVRGVNAVTSEIVPIEYKDEVVITIMSTPAGAEVLRNGVAIGTTPFEYKAEAVSGASEQWVISYPDREPVMQLIAMDKTETYNVNIMKDLKSSKRLGKVTGGPGRSVFGIGFNVSPMIRSLKSSAEKGKPVSYTSQVIPVFSFDIELFPFGLGVNNDYLQGLGLQSSIGFGIFDSTLKAGTSKHECSIGPDGQTLSCSSSYIRFNLDLVYRLLFQKKAGKLNSDGMGLDFILGYNMARYNIAKNALYTGHDYNGAKLGLKFHTPLGLPEFRFQAGVNFYFNGGHGPISKLHQWGSRKDSSWGTNILANFLYDVYKGIYLRAGYSFTYMGTDFGGIGCLDSQCSVPKEAYSKDMYHEIMLGIGYMLY